MHTPPIINASEIKTLLPCPEKLCESLSPLVLCPCKILTCSAERGSAVSGGMARAEARLPRTHGGPNASKAACVRVVGAAAGVDLARSVRRSVSRHHVSSNSKVMLTGATPLDRVLIQGLHLMVHNARQLHLSGLTNHAELVTTQIRRSLCRLSRGPDEFTPRFGGNANSIDEPSVYAAPRVGYHLAHLATHIPLEELDLVALKAGEVAAMNTLDKWTSWMGSQAERARTIALHSGQILRIVRDYPTHGEWLHDREAGLPVLMDRSHLQPPLNRRPCSTPASASTSTRARSYLSRSPRRPNHRPRRARRSRSTLTSKEPKRRMPVSGSPSADRRLSPTCR